MGQGTQAALWEPEKTGTRIPPGSPGQRCGYLAFSPNSPRTVRQYLALFKPLICGHLLQAVV